MDSIVPALAAIADFADVRNAYGLGGLLFNLLDGIGAVEGLVDLLEGGTARLNEEEVDHDELNDDPAFEEEVELPAAGGDAQRNGILRQEQADVCGEALQEQTVGAEFEAENLERVGHVERDPGSTG